MEWITANIWTLINIANAIVATASLIVKLTPSSHDDEVVSKLKRIIEILSLKK